MIFRIQCYTMRVPPNWLDVATLKTMNARLSSIYAGAMLEIIDYIEVTWTTRYGSTLKFTLADCEVIDVLAKRPELCSLEAGDRITVLLYASPRYPTQNQCLHEYIEPYEWEPFYRGQRFIHCLAPIEGEGRGFGRLAPWVDYYAGIYEYLYRMPVEQGKADFTGFGRYLHIPELFENYGGMVDGWGRDRGLDHGNLLFCASGLLGFAPICIVRAIRKRTYR